MLEPTDPQVCILVLHWNRGEDTHRCLQSLQNLAYENCRILVIDNGSTDGSPEWLRQQHPGISILQAPGNCGFAGGNNLGLRHIQDDPPCYVWLLNNDTTVAPEALRAMVRVAEANPRTGAVGSILLDQNEPATIQAWGGGRINFISGLPNHHRGPVTPGNLHYLIGASMLIRWTALQQIGFLDDRYFLYWEDADLCYRLRAAGWQLDVAEAAVIRHLGSASIEFKSPLWDFHFTASSVKFFLRHARLPLLPIVVSSTGRMVRRIICREWKNAGAVWKGLRAGGERIESLD